MTQINADEYKAFAAKLRGADKAIARGIRKQIRAAATPIGREVIETGSEGMPSRGGLRSKLQAASPSVSIMARGATINLRKGANFAALNRGILRHPIYGSKRWTQQGVPSGTYTGAMQNLPPDARAGLQQVLKQAMKELGL